MLARSERSCNKLLPSPWSQAKDPVRNSLLVAHLSPLPALPLLWRRLRLLVKSRLL